MNKSFINYLTIVFLSLCVSFIFINKAKAAAYTSVQYEERYDGIYALKTQTLTKDKSPYFIAGGCAVGSLPSYATLTVEAGVVVKFDLPRYCSGAGVSSNISIYGNLVVNGTEQDPVIFTSFADDTGGDSNGDGRAASPKPGDWGALRLSPGAGNKVVLKNAVIRYGAGRGFVSELMFGGSSNPSDVELNNLDITLSACYGFGASVPVTIVNSKFHNNSCGAIYGDVYSNPQINAVNNWWGDDSGPTAPANPGGKGEKYVGNVIFNPWVGKVTNLPPKLSFPENDTDGAEPNIDYLPAQPSFSVVYSDPNSDNPSFVNVVINSSAYQMTASSSTVSGTLYTFTPATGTLQKGGYTFHFEAGDGKLVTRLPDIGQVDPVFAVRNRPVILIPGIAGTELKYGNELLWLNLEKMLFDIGDDFLDKMAMNTDGTPIINMEASDVIRVKEFLPRLAFKYFSGLINDLENNGFKENEDLFVFPYDWRLDNQVNATKLSDKIAAIISKTRSSKVNLVAHSMGGLLAKLYIINNGTSSIDKLVFMGTPHLGSPDAFKTLLSGSNFGIPFLAQREIQKLAQNMSTVYQLLPSKKYLEQSGGYFIRNGVVNDFGQTNNYLLDMGSNAFLLNSASKFHSEGMDNFNATGVEMYNVVGCHSPTLEKIIERTSVSESGLISRDYDLVTSGGDGTVPLQSALAISVPNYNRYFVKDSTHSKMPSEDGTRELVVQIIVGNLVQDNLPKKVSKDSTGCFLNGNLISVHSPVSLSVNNVLGEHVGPGDYGSVDEQITGASYFEVEGDKFIFLPDDNENYYVKINALGSGSFSFKALSIKNDVIESSEIFSDIPIVTSSLAELSLHGQDSPLMKIDKYGNGNFETILPSAILDSSQSVDYEKPQTSILYLGEKGLDNWYRSPVRIEMSATDNNSGILYTEYSLDDGSTWSKYDQPFVVDREGKTGLLYRSVDRANNREDVKEAFVYIDSKSPEFEISFSTTTSRLTIIGVDEISSTTIERGCGLLKIHDQAGNFTVIFLKVKEEKKRSSIQISGIKYGNKNEVFYEKALIHVENEANKNGVLSKIEQEISINRNFEISAHYERKQNITKIKIFEAKRKGKSEIINGLILLKLISNNGNLNYKY